jgi:hypothetical protein
MNVCEFALLNWRMTDLSLGNVKILSIMKYDGNQVLPFSRTLFEWIEREFS